MLSRIQYAVCGAWSFGDYWTETPVHLQLLVPLTLDSWLWMAEQSICFVTIRAEAQVLVVDIGTENRWSSSAECRSTLGPRVDLDWGTRKVLPEQTSIIEGIAGWHFLDRNDLMSLTMWASLLSPSSSSLRNNRSMSAWASRGTSYIIRAAFFLLFLAFLWMTSSFFKCVFAAEEKIEEQYSICDLIRAC